MEVTVRDLKSRLSEYLRKVASGEEMIVTSRGKEVARLVPPNTPGRAASNEAEAIARFRSLAWVRPSNGKKPALPKPLIRLGKGEKTLAQIVIEQRR